MRLEELKRDQLFLPFAPKRLQYAADAREEFSKPCGRFKSPFAFEEAASRRIAETFARLDYIEKYSLLIAPGTPLNWLQLLSYLQEEKVIQEAQFFPTEFSNDRPKLPALTLYPAAETDRTDGQKVYFGGHATAETPDEMMSKVIGEMLERYFLTIYRARDMRIASPAEMRRRKVRMLDIAALNGYLPFQVEKFPRFRRDDTMQLSWVKGIELLSGTAAYIPSQLTFWNYLHMKEKGSAEPVLADMTTSGSGGHFTRDEAILSALLEAVERDGFLIYWLNKLAPAKLDLDTYDDSDVRAMLAYAKRYRLEMHFLDTTTDIGIPTVTCVIVDRVDLEPVIQIASCSGFNLRDVILHAGREALMVYSFATKGKTFALPDDYQPFLDGTVGHIERVCSWRSTKMLERFEFFLAGTKRSPADFIGDNEQIATVADKIAHLLRQFKRMGAGYEVYIYEAKHRILDRIGYHVVRAIIPQLVPLYLNENYATLDSKRLREVPEKLGFKAADKYNPWPHPFP